MLTQIYKASVFVFCIRPKTPPAIATQVSTERNVFLLFSGELDTSHCDALLPIEDGERLDSVICFYW